MFTMIVRQARGKGALHTAAVASSVVPQLGSLVKIANTEIEGRVENVEFHYRALSNGGSVFDRVYVDLTGWKVGFGKD